MASPSLNIGRYSVTGAVYMVTAVTVRRQQVLGTPAAAHAIEASLRSSDALAFTESIAWVVMPDHLHWLFELRAKVLSRPVQRLKSTSARQVNAAVGRQGPLWQAGFHDRQMRRDEDLRAHARYILANPVRGRLAVQVGEYPYAWCRYGNCL
jgi:REP element-mobilizing transposase RayT